MNIKTKIELGFVSDIEMQKVSHFKNMGNTFPALLTLYHVGDTKGIETACISSTERFCSMEEFSTDTRTQPYTNLYLGDKEQECSWNMLHASCPELAIASLWTVAH